jgi:trehalose utilization protein/type 1 glutamine amidotransferase
MKFIAACIAVFTFLASFGHAAERPIRVTVWDEQQPAQQKVYTNFLGNHIAAHLQKNPRFEVRSVSIKEPNLGLTTNLLQNTDVLIWWGHVRHDHVPQALGDAIVARVKSGHLALIALHSAHWSVPFRTAMEARLIQDKIKLLPVGERGNVEPEFIQWRAYALPSRAEKPDFDTRFEKRADGKWHLLIERPSCVFPSCCTPMQPSKIQTLLPAHPIAKDIPATFTLPETEMYDEPFHVPEPDEVIFRESWAGGEHFRSGITWRLGRGEVFYFRPGHETYRVYTEPLPLKIIENASAHLGAKVQANASRPNFAGVLDRMLVFSKTSWYRHPAIPMIDDWLVELGSDYGFKVDVTEDPSKFTAENLRKYKVALFISTTDIGKSLDAAQKKAFIDWFRAGNGLVAMHAAGVHHDTWDWYSGLFGTDFDSDSEYVAARVNVDASARNNSILQGLPATFTLDGDWLNFKRSIRGLEGVQILLTLDEKSYDPVRPLFKQRGGKPMGADHPMAWLREYEGGRFAYTMIGHDTRPLETDFGQTHVMRLIRWAAGARD